jgi:hypothetical protein
MGFLGGGGGANGPQQAGMFGGSGASGPQSINPVGISETGLGGPTPQWYRTLATAQPMGLVNGPMQGGFPGLGPQAAPQSINPVNPVSFSGGAGQGGQQQQGGISSNPYYSAFLAGPQQQQQQGGMFGGGAGPAYAGTFSGNNNAPSMPRPPSLFAKGGSVSSPQGIASLGRGDDKMLVHMTPGEVQSLQRLAMAHGGSLTINPHRSARSWLPEKPYANSVGCWRNDDSRHAANGCRPVSWWWVRVGVGQLEKRADGRSGRIRRRRDWRGAIQHGGIGCTTNS